MRDTNSIWFESATNRAISLNHIEQTNQQQADERDTESDISSTMQP